MVILNRETDMYNEMYAKVQAGVISEKVWQDYCFTLLVELLNKNINVFKRLADR